MKRGIIAFFCVVILLSGQSASAAEIYPIVFPVVGQSHFTDNYSAPRAGGRTHEAIDIMADKMTPVVAAADGTVSWMSSGVYTDSCTGMTTPSYSLKLEHDDGYQSWYIHLNNDTPGTDDGLGDGYAPGIVRGARVSAGQLLGWVGDSGNAECVASHLHFQLHYPDGTRFNPYESLLAATHVNPVAADEIFFYREDGLFRYYKTSLDAGLGSPLASGDAYTKGWTTITAINLDGDGDDEMFFYRDDGLFRYYQNRPDGSLPSPILAGNGYTVDWTSISAVDLDGDGQDEMFFYRDDGLFRYYEIHANGEIGSPLAAGNGYTTGWDVITAVDLDGDGQDEMFFYRKDGLYRYYNVQPDGTLTKPLRAGSDYPPGWTSITAIDINGDHHDEMLFYRDDGLYQYNGVGSTGVLTTPILAGNDYTAGWDSIASVELDG